MKRDSALFFTCSLIEYLGRSRKLKRSEVVKVLEAERIARIYSHADILHSEPIEHVADEFSEISQMPMGDFDNVGSCRYLVPDYWTIGEVYERLIEDVSDGDVVATTLKVYGSWIDAAISNYNTDFYYQPRDFLRECYLAGRVI